MRKKVSVVLCGIFVVLLVLCNNPVFADENETYIDNDLCESNETALPDSVPCSTTVALVDELLEGGYSDSLIVINSYQYAYSTLCQLYDIFGQLESCPDSASLLLERLTILCSYYENWNTRDKLNVEMLFLMLQQEPFLQQMSHTEYSEFCKLMYGNCDESGLQIPQSASVSIGNSEYNPKYGITYTVVAFTETVTGTAVPLYQADKELSANDIAAYIEVNASIAGAVKLSNPSAKYNCHSYAWYNRSDSNGYWIEYGDPYVNDSHTILVEQPFAEVGDLVVYYNGNTILHSAVIEETDGTNIVCVSKWGRGGLMRHALSAVPKEYYPNTPIVDVSYYYVIYNHNYSELISTSGSNHVYQCSYCSATHSAAHTYTYSFDTETHTAMCTTCGKTVTSAHSLSVTSNNSSSTHSIYCSICGASVTESHSYTTTANGDGDTHTRTCSVCHYSISQSHNFSVVVSKNGATHTMKCNLCTQRKTEAHIQNSAGTICIVCSYKGPFLEQLRVKNEDMLNDDGHTIEECGGA